MYIRHEIALSKWLIVIQFINYSKIVEYAREIQDGYKTGTVFRARTRRNAAYALKKRKSRSLSNVLNYRNLTFERTVVRSFVFCSLTHLICSPVTLFSFFSIAPSRKRESPFGCTNQLVTNLGCSYMQFVMPF